MAVLSFARFDPGEVTGALVGSASISLANRGVGRGGHHIAAESARHIASSATSTQPAFAPVAAGISCCLKPVAITVIFTSSPIVSSCTAPKIIFASSCAAF